jgi:hypothetical protein
LNKFVFLASHLGSGSEQILHVLNAQRTIDIKTTGNTYVSKLDILNAYETPHKISNAEAIYGEHVLFNYNLASYSFFEMCKFLYVVRSAAPSLNLIVRDYGYAPEAAVSYYCYRLRRLYEIAQKTPNSILINFDSLPQTTNAIEEFLELKTPLWRMKEVVFDMDYPKILSHSQISYAQERYEYYLYLMKNLSTVQHLGAA